MTNFGSDNPAPGTRLWRLRNHPDTLTLEDAIAVARDLDRGEGWALLKLDDLRVLSEAATPGPWGIPPDGERLLGGDRDAWDDYETLLYLIELANPTANAAFIVAAVNAIRAALLPTQASDSPEPKETR